ncbi:MAG: DUF4167 domain-containing protein [Gemmobacter sp.]|uniref:DUF4167 domain-containing protein n=1 Tax=Gemmobacter sp. TaxID=1898957 RepID=UPI00391A5F5C
MRSSKSRSRSKQNRPRSIGNIVNRVFDSSGPEGKVRGTPQQIIEKYQTLARDAQLSNDRVAAENFLQHAEHYTRMLGEAMREMAAEQDQRRQGQGPNGNGQPNQGGDRGGYAPRRDEREDEQPDIGPVPVFGFADVTDDADSGLVETPEARQEPPPRPAPHPQNPPRGDRRPDNRPAERNDNRSDNRASEGPRPPRPDQPRSDHPRRDRDDRRRDDRPRRDEAPRPVAEAAPSAEAAPRTAPRPEPKPVVAEPESTPLPTVTEAKPAPAAVAPAPAAPQPEPAPTPEAPAAPVAADPASDAPAKPRRPRAPRKPKEPGSEPGPDSAAAE